MPPKSHSLGKVRPKKMVRRKRFSFPCFSNLSGEAQVRQMKQLA